MSSTFFIIPLPSPFSFEECLWFLDRNFDDCMHSVKGNEVRKVVTIDDQHLLVSLTSEKNELHVAVLNVVIGKALQEKLKRYITDWLDLVRDLRPFYKLLRNNEQLAYMVKDYAGLRLIGIPDLFEAICWSVIGQQINLPFAYKMKRRLVERHGTSIAYDGSVYYVFPAPEVLANVPVEELRAMQFSNSKANYLITVAKAFAAGHISREILQALPELADKQKALTAMKGVGIWTANYVLMKTLKEPTCILHGDAGLLNALIRHNIISDKKDSAAIDQFFAGFSGWESYLVFYLWRSLAKR